MDRRWKATVRRAACGFVVIQALGMMLAPARAEPAVAPVGPYAGVARELERWIAAEVEAKDLPALSIALVDDQRIVWARGFGLADPSTGTPATADTPYRVGSVSKLFTDLAAMQLVEEGKVDLDAPVGRVLPEFAPRNPYDAPITLRQLMSHRSGLVREPRAGHYFDPTPPPLIEVVKSLNETTLVAPPGKRTKYSNAGVSVVGAVVERLRGEPFASAVGRTLIGPLGLSRTSFEPGPDLSRELAHAAMWTYDGQRIATPTFLLGTGPAGNLVSTVNDLGRFLSVLFADGVGPGGPIVRPSTLRSMMTPQLGKPGETPTYGLGFALSMLDGRRRFGHGGAIYGFATQLSALPDEKLGVAVVATRDAANGTTKQVADNALRLMLGARKGRPPSTLETTDDVAPGLARRLEGRYAGGDKVVDLVARRGKLFASPLAGNLRVEVRGHGDDLIVDDCLMHGPTLVPGEGRIVLGIEGLKRVDAPKPAPAPDRWAPLIGEYGWDHSVLYIFEKEGRLHALIEWFFAYPLEEEGPDRFRFPGWGLYEDEGLTFSRDESGRVSQVEAAGVVFRRRHLDGEDGSTYRVKPVRPVEEIRPGTLAARPPAEAGDFLPPDLVDLAALDPTIKLDIRYATSNNFLGTPVYTSARAFLQRPAAEALLRAHKALESQGYGLLIHDAYRPWNVTKLFWDATPRSAHGFVANPSTGSRHNRGSAVDLSLYDRATGKPVAMVGGYDEFSPRSNPDYPGGTDLQRWCRDLLRRAMEDQGFTVNRVEWWHFDHRDWARYPIQNQSFEELKATAGPG